MGRSSDWKSIVSGHEALEGKALCARGKETANSCRHRSKLKVQKETVIGTFLAKEISHH